MTLEHAHACNIETAEEYFETNLSMGLDPEEAQARLQRFGPNELRDTPPTPLWRMLLDQFRNFVVLILVVACVISFFLGEYIEGTAILAIVVLNAVLGVVQESKAESALRALKKLAAPEAHVLRDGHLLTIPSRELVPGDIVTLETGNYVPADVRLVESVNLRIDEASLTGESVPVEKDAHAVLDADLPLGDRRNMAYMSTVVTYGRGRGLVVATGMETQIGRIAEMIQTYEEEPTPLQVKLDQVGKYLGVVMLAICGIIFALGLLRSQPLLEMFFIAVSLAIAAVPEGLPAVVTIALALGMQEMIRRNALIRKLPAVETLGSASAICSDKTGTLTQNEMTAVRFFVDGRIISASGRGYQPEGQFYHNGRLVESLSNGSLQKLLAASMLCNDAFLEPGEHTRTWRIVGDPTEGALVVAAAKDGLWKAEVESTCPRVAEIPFDSVRKRMTTIHRMAEAEGGGTERASLLSGFCDSPTDYVAFVKGAPDILLDRCSYVENNGTVTELDSEERQKIMAANEVMTEQALRVLGVAYRVLSDIPEDLAAETVERDLIFLGLIGMIDPARPEVRDAIRLARGAGIRTVMVTGDYKNTAAAIARELDLLRSEGRVVTGQELDSMDDEELVRIAEEVDVFARVSPEHKVRIVEALKRRGHVVAMTGDGVNDAPALKRADIGVAMGITGTDVSKETADMVLTDDNYASIVSAVEQGRVIYANIRKFVYYLLSCNVAEITIIFLATLLGWPVPLTAIQLLWLNLVTDGAPALALGLEKGEPDIMEQPPRPVDEPIINRLMVRGIAIQTVAISAVTLTAFALGLRWFPEDRAIARTMAFLTLATSELFRAYTSRSERYPLLKIGLFANRYMQLAVMTSLALLLTVTYLPFLRPVFGTVALGLDQWMVMTPLILVPAVVAELNKAVMRLRRPGSGQPGVAPRQTSGAAPA